MKNKKNVLRILTFSIFLLPLNILSAPQNKLLTRKSLSAQCPVNKIPDCRDPENPEKCDTVENLKTQLCELLPNSSEEKNKWFQEHYENLNKVYADFVKNISQTGKDSIQALTQKFTSEPAPTGYAINLAPTTPQAPPQAPPRYERISATESPEKYKTLGELFPSYFPENKVNCINLKEIINIISDASLVSNKKEMFETIFEKSCLNDGSRFAKAYEDNTQLQSELMTMVAQKLPEILSVPVVKGIYNKQKKDSSGHIILNDKGEPVYELDPSLRTPISPKLGVLNLGTDENQIQVPIVENFNLLNLEQLFAYLSYLYCLSNFSVNHCPNPNEPQKESKGMDIGELLGILGLVSTVVLFAPSTYFQIKEYYLKKGSPDLERTSAKVEAAQAEATEITESIAKFAETLGKELKLEEGIVRDLSSIFDLTKLSKIEGIEALLLALKKDGRLNKFIGELSQAKTAKNLDTAEFYIRDELGRLGYEAQDVTRLTEELMKIAKIKI